MRKIHSTPAAHAVGLEDEYHSAGLWEGLSRQLGSFLGIFIVAAVAAAALALASWNFADPSLNNYVAVTNPTNILGFWGASFADIFMQFFGLGSVAALLPPFFWGLLLIMQKKPSRLRRRLWFWPLGIICFSAACALLPIPQNWPMPIGLGGVTGDKLINLFRLSFVYSSFFTFIAAAGCLFALGLFCAAYAGGVILRTQGRNRHKKHKSAMQQRTGTPFYPEIETENTPRNGTAVKTNFPGVDLSDDIGEENEENSAGSAERLHNFTGLLQHIYLSCGAFLRRLTGKPHKARHHSGTDKHRAGAEPYIDIDTEDGSAGDFTSPAVLTASERRGAAHETRHPHAEAASQQNGFFSILNGKYEKNSKYGKNRNFALPALNYLAKPKKLPHNEHKILRSLQRNAQILAGVLEDFGVKGDIVQAYPGPVVTLYELEPAPGVKSSRIISLSDDIARSMSASSARIAIIPKRNALGIELPNHERETVYLRELLESREYSDNRAKLALALGQSIGGETVIADLAKMPHLLVAGTTGSGKSVAINTMILSLLYRMTPQECRLIMVDPKMLELSVYEGIPHLLTPVVTDPKKALSALKWAVREMEERYRKMAKLGVRNIDGFNARVREAQKSGEENLSRTLQTGFDKETGKPIFETEELAFEILPYIVVIIDEMADLMMVAGKEIEGAIQRLAQMARAAGIHVIMATQRPSVDVITGTIKANFPTRISFQVTSKIDSRTILGEQGAEQLLGQGDMLYMEGGGRIKRIHGPFVGDSEVEKVVAHLKKQGAPEYLSAVMECNDDEDENAENNNAQISSDPYDKAVDIVLRDRKASTSYIQRRLGIGYNRAASIIERMEEEGVISAANHAGKREILVPERKAS